ncbi:ferritin-like domain-containing protein [Niastella caeni]|uniref:Ferritin-like domain-containing protein n=1 Tax=Niastella caeni TaxID=2569763 RepID=A0A4S8HG70_9BACT|nr:ferritin-like domain-containing protein [Niastella caeni]THU34150.1 ferritin-like domain-containing protein [Niastella caeni]
MANQTNAGSQQSTRRSTGNTDSKLHLFFMQQLQDVYWAEKKLVKTLPKLAEAATSTRLKQAFNDHLEQTIHHVTRLENIFNLLGEEPKGLKCAAMAGIVDEGADIIDETDEGSAQRDVGLIFAAQKAEHYEIATYGGLVTLARTMGHDDAAELLDQTLAEEKVTDNLLTKIAEEDANVKANEERIDN